MGKLTVFKVVKNRKSFRKQNLAWEIIFEMTADVRVCVCDASFFDARSPGVVPPLSASKTSNERSAGALMLRFDDDDKTPVL